MDKPFFKQHIRIHGLNHGLDFEKDKIGDEYENAARRQAEDEERMKALKNKHFDPLYMETDLPDPPETGDISLDPNDMTFDFD